MSDIREAIKLISGKESSAEQVQRIQAIAHSCGFALNDSMMPILIVLDTYHGAFKELPELAQQVADEIANTVATQANVAIKLERTAAAIAETHAAVERSKSTMSAPLLQALSKTQHSIVPSTNMWLGAAAGTMLAFLAGLAVHFETVSQLLMGTFIFVAGGISCFFFLRHKNKKQ